MQPHEYDAAKSSTRELTRKNALKALSSSERLAKDQPRRSWREAVVRV